MSDAGTTPDRPVPWPARPDELIAWASAYAGEITELGIDVPTLLAQLAEVRATAKTATAVEEWLLMATRAAGATLEDLAEVTGSSRKYVRGPDKRLNRLAEQYGRPADRLAALQRSHPQSATETRRPVSIEITDESMTSDVTRHTARPLTLSEPYGPWQVSWLPGRELTRNEAITAMTLAETVATEVPHSDHPEWSLIDALADELGLTVHDAVTRVSEPLDD